MLTQIIVNLMQKLLIGTWKSVYAMVCTITNKVIKMAAINGFKFLVNRLNFW